MGVKLKFFPEEITGPSTQVATSDENAAELLKTIRLSKNIFSLTERLPKSKYQSPKLSVITSGQNLMQGGTQVK